MFENKKKSTLKTLKRRDFVNRNESSERNVGKLKAVCQLPLMSSFFLPKINCYIDDPYNVFKNTVFR